MVCSTDKILSLTKTPIKADELLKLLPDMSRKELLKILESLISDGRLLKNKKGKYALSEHFGCTSGIFSATDRSFSFVTPDINPAGGDIFIPPRRDNGAWQGDRVLVKLSPKPPFASQKQEGEVIKILSRNKADITGRLIERKKLYFLQPDSSKYPPIEIPKNKRLNAELGDKVAVKMVFWGDKKYLPQGTVTRVLGEDGTLSASASAILHSNGIYGEFPSKVLEQADSIGAVIDPEQRNNRLDLRNKLIFTIDGDTAKDFDDAVSLETLPNGHLQLGVHIADVSQYVTQDSPLDGEAYNRGTSVYYANKVIPMLPFALSNGICSLNPDVERFCFSVFMEMDEQGKRYGFSFHKSVILSKARMTYHNVNLILSNDEKMCAKYPQLVENLKAMNSLAENMRARRMERGALELNIPEAQILCDENDKVTDVVLRERGASEKMIEEFMLIANETVAEYLFTQKAPTVYRVHENPDPNKLKIFADYAKIFGYKLRGDDFQDTHMLQAILDSAEKHPEQRVLPMMLLRSLARARYAPDCIGHYGLAAKYYLHFTSPIRRYPDLVTHRMLMKQISGEVFSDSDRIFCEEASKQSTVREMAADNAERDIEKLYMADYMTKFIGEEFDAVISGVQNFGIFAELPNTIEGLIRLESIKNDYFEYDDEKMILIGKKSGKRYAIGMSIKVRCLNASPLNGQIDFELIQ